MGQDFAERLFADNSIDNTSLDDVIHFPDAVTSSNAPMDHSYMLPNIDSLKKDNMMNDMRSAGNDSPPAPPNQTNVRDGLENESYIVSPLVGAQQSPFQTCPMPEIDISVLRSTNDENKSELHPTHQGGSSVVPWTTE